VGHQLSAKVEKRTKVTICFWVRVAFIITTIMLYINLWIQ